LLSYRADYTGRPWFAPAQQTELFQRPDSWAPALLPACWGRLGDHSLANGVVLTSMAEVMTTTATATNRADARTNSCSSQSVLWHGSIAVRVVRYFGSTERVGGNGWIVVVPSATRYSGHQSCAEQSSDT
jgi:hypothetical protein